MIGKIKRGTSFAGVCGYVLKKDKEVPAKIIGGNMEGQNPKQLAAEFEVFAKFNDRVKVPVKHFSLSFAEQDGVVSDDVKILLAMDYMEQMGYGNSQYVVVSHDRTDHDHAHDHIHIVASSVAMDGKWVKDRLDWKRSQTVLRTLEREHDLTPVASTWDKNRDKSLASKLGQQVERSSHGKIELSEIERTHSEIQAKIELAATGAASITQFCARLQALAIDPIAKITRTGKVQGISYRSGNAVARGSDLQRASFPALQQRGIEFDPAQDLASLKSALRGGQLEIEREWVDNLPVAIREENIEVTVDPVLTHPEIPKIPTVTTNIEVTSPKVRDLKQERKDNDLLLVAGDYPELRKTLEYQEAKERARILHYEQTKSMPKHVAEPTPPPPVPAVKKWEPTLQQKTDPRLVHSILETADRLGTDGYKAGNYQVQILEEQIEVKYRNELAMVIDTSSDAPESQLIGRGFTLNQYERGLGGSIDVLVTDLEQQREQEKAQEREQQRQAELQRQLEQQQQEQAQLKFEFPPESPMLDFSEKPQDIDRHRQQDIGYSR